MDGMEEEMSEKEREKVDELSILFPEKEVELPDGSKVVVKPLSLKQLPKVVSEFATVLSDAAHGGRTPTELAVNAFAALLKIMPYCISRPPDRIPAEVVPDILEIVAEQNFSEGVLGKWSALIQKLLQSPVVKKAVGDLDQSR